MINRRTLGGMFGAAALALSTLPAAAQEVTLKLHQFLPAQANVPKLILDVWADTIEQESDGRIEVERYPSMQLGGSPPQLMDQAIDGGEGHGGVGKDLAPFAERLVGGDQH